MYKRIESGIKVDKPMYLGRALIGAERKCDPIGNGSANIGDTIFVQKNEHTEFQIKVEGIEGNDVKGTLTGITVEKIRKEEHEGWSVGDKIIVSNDLVSGINRQN